jgi:hypothetical protein
MLLRRVIEHVREQNWTAVGIDFAIVVIGVFVGIQVANWNEERLQQRQEHGFLAQLREEIAGNVETIEHQLRYQAQVIGGGRRALAFLEAGVDCAAECESLLVDFFHASQFWGTPYTRAKYEEMQRLGFPSDPVTRRGVDDFYLFIDGWDAVTASAPAYRQRVRGHISPEAAEILWQGCWQPVGGNLEVLLRDCEAALKSLDVAAMLRSIGADAAMEADLRFWVGQNIFGVRAFPKGLDHADSAIAAINAELEPSR